MGVTEQWKQNNQSKSPFLAVEERKYGGREFVSAFEEVKLKDEHKAQEGATEPLD
jgi:hypothetical protein